MILIVVVPILLVLLVIRSARVRSQEKQQLLNEQAQGILGSGFGGNTSGPCFVGPFFFPFLPAFGAVRVAIRVFCVLVVSSGICRTVWSFGARQNSKKRNKKSKTSGDIRNFCFLACRLSRPVSIISCAPALGAWGACLAKVLPICRGSHGHGGGVMSFLEKREGEK